MNPIVKKDILNVLHESVAIVKEGQLYKLRELSDHVIHNAAVFQDKDSITVAVTVYSLSKLDKNHTKLAIPHLKNAVKYLEQGILGKYEDEMKLIIKDISDEKTKFYIQEVLERAQIKKASKLFEHGISLGQVADALGISLWEVMDYVGKTTIIDQFRQKTDVIQKLQMTRKMFGR